MEENRELSCTLIAGLQELKRLCLSQGLRGSLLWKQEQRERRVWEDLAEAIILRAVEDYRTARRELRARSGRSGREEAERQIREVEEVLSSRWFTRLTKADGRMILARLRDEE